MDRQQLRSHVFDQTGIKVDVNDPIFALVALNEAVLADTVERQLAVLDAASQALAAQACIAGGLPPPAAATATTANPAQQRWFSPREWRLLGAAALVSLATSTLVLAGAALLWRHTS